MLTQDELKYKFHYDPDTGLFTYKKSYFKTNIGKVAGEKSGAGYILLRVNNKVYYAHRLAWLYVHGTEPLELIDHINRIRNDNRIVNLREASKAENGYNRKIGNNSSSGIKGISWCVRHKRWVARVSVNKIRKCIGYFRSISDAESAIADARKKYHGEFEYHAKA